MRPFWFSVKSVSVGCFLLCFESLFHMSDSNFASPVLLGLISPGCVPTCSLFPHVPACVLVRVFQRSLLCHTTTTTAITLVVLCLLSSFPEWS